MKQERIYHILIDRFFPMRDEDANGNFKGGCIRSIIEHLDYIQGLGMSGIMLTPFYKTATYHGYHIVDFEQVDPHFGTKTDVKELVNEVHKRGMVIVADLWQIIVTSLAPCLVMENIRIGSVISLTERINVLLALKTCLCLIQRTKMCSNI